ncbi:putative transposase [Mesorhizobium robiniae]|uniref:Transposase n=1 Tax=Mesorhizobium robiniae TaxID=559315 RepID=A0ABV2GZU0_9HYPH
MLDQIVQTRRNTKAARRLLTRLLKRQGLPPSVKSSTECVLRGPNASSCRTWNTVRIKA